MSVISNGISTSACFRSCRRSRGSVFAPTGTARFLRLDRQQLKRRVAYLIDRTTADILSPPNGILRNLQKAMVCSVHRTSVGNRSQHEPGSSGRLAVQPVEQSDPRLSHLRSRFRHAARDAYTMQSFGIAGTDESPAAQLRRRAEASKRFAANLVFARPTCGIARIGNGRVRAPRLALAVRASHSTRFASAAMTPA
jgi:hypothetical protein